MTEEEKHDERQRELVRRWKQNGDQAAMNELIDGTKGLVYKWIKKTRTFAKADREEIYAAGILGIMEAARRFDPERGTKFSGAAWNSIQDSVHNVLRLHASPASLGKSRIERSMRQRGMSTMARAMSQGIDEEEAIKMAATASNVSVEMFSAMLMSLRQVDNYLEDSDDLRFVAQTDTEREIILRSNKEKVLQIVAKVLLLYPVKTRESFIRRFIRVPHEDVKDIAAEEGVSQQAVRVRHDPVLEDIRYRVAKAGLNMEDFM